MPRSIFPRNTSSPLFILFVSMALGVLTFLTFSRMDQLLKGLLFLVPFILVCYLNKSLLPAILTFFLFGLLLAFNNFDTVFPEPGSSIEVTGKVKKVYSDDFFLASGSFLVNGEWKRLPSAIMIKTRSDVEITPDTGKIFWASGMLDNLSPFQMMLDSEVIAYGPTIGLDRFAGNIRKGIVETLENYGVTNPVIFSTFFGNKSRLKKEVKNALKAIGISHIFAVSGLHIGLFFLLVNYFMSLFLLPFIFRNLASLSITGIYVLTTGPSLSAMRAFLMLFLYVLFRVLDYPQSSLNILGLSGIIMLTFSPFDLVQADFQLSYLSTAGILLYIMVKDQKRRSPLVNVLLIGGAAQGVTLPVSLSLFGSFALLGIPMTFIAVFIYLIPTLVGTVSLLLFDLLKIKPLAVFFAKGLEYLSNLFESFIVKLSRSAPVIQLEFPLNYFVAFLISVSVFSLFFFLAHSEQSP
ncbi:ComEC/Rec2 family competence protein [Kosmotoga pacifica]|uniref:ComEC/Rec2-related protein domain-containing protein n=1 Tax=Kosmotoga pacifica TaxID=1330330 RepID=A0A0G2ZDX5_9BACT|nr:ComEC/Rec2 family competence protein [Kosmotoga pacifica]AKI97003.1 hypothetical protein IX53_03270 [Kosmotoga pacifica]